MNIYMHRDLQVSGPLCLIFLMSSVFTLSGIALFGFPASMPASLAGVPAAVPAVYRALAAVFMLSFGLLYLALALQRTVPAVIVLFAAIAKVLAFLAFAGLWLAGSVSTQMLLMVSGDIVIAALLLHALASQSKDVP